MHVCMISAAQRTEIISSQAKEHWCVLVYCDARGLCVCLSAEPRPHAALVSAAKVMRYIQCCLVFDAMKIFRWDFQGLSFPCKSWNFSENLYRLLRNCILSSGTFLSATPYIQSVMAGWAHCRIDVRDRRTAKKVKLDKTSADCRAHHYSRGVHDFFTIANEHISIRCDAYGIGIRQQQDRRAAAAAARTSNWHLCWVSLHRL